MWRGFEGGKRGEKGRANIAFLFLSVWLAWTETFDVVYRVDQREEINTNISVV